MANPVIQLMMQKFFDEKFKDMTNSGEKIVNKVRVVEKEVNNSNMIKSPSDMTIYAPALNRKSMTPVGVVQKGLQTLNMNTTQINQEGNEGLVDRNIIFDTLQPTSVCNGRRVETVDGDVISNFVEAVRLRNHP